MIQDSWHDFERTEIQRRREAATSRLRSANLTDEELLTLQREVMDLKNREDLIVKRDRRDTKRNP